MTLYDASRLQSIDSGDPGIVGFFLGLFLETVPPAVADIRAAFLSGDLARVSSLAHRIKPSIMELHIPVPIAEIEMAAGVAMLAGKFSPLRKGMRVGVSDRRKGQDVENDP